MSVIVSTLFAHHACPQRNTRFGLQNCSAWANSLRELELPGVVFYSNIHTGFMEREYSNIEFIRATDFFPEWQDALDWNAVDVRWLLYDFWLRRARPDAVFFTDISDVLVKQNPFSQLQPATVYCGDEPTTVNHPWMHQIARAAGDPKINKFLKTHGSQQLLNAGVLGGHYDPVMRFIQEIRNQGLHPCHTTIDMLYFNYVGYNLPAGLTLQHGAPVNSVFRGNEVNRTDVWFVHK
jgi:hypothetical protein